MRTKLFNLLVALCCATSMFAYDAYIGGIYYNLDKSAKTAEVTNRTGSYNTNSYSGVVVIPSTITYNSQTYSVTTVGNYAFSYCSGLTSVTIPSSVTAIRSSAFSVCRGLKKTNYTGTIADWCKIKFGSGDANPMYHSHNFFINNVEVKDLVIPDGITTIGDWAFYGCSGLTSVTIPNSVTTIGEDAFYLCSGLTSVTIPNSVTTIGYHAFLHVNNIVYSGTATGSPWGAKCVNGYVEGYLVYSDATKTKICGCFSAAMGVVTIPSSVTTIGSSAFYDCSGLTKTNYTGTIADWCKIKFGDYDANPMYYSHNFFINNVEVKDLVIPDGITTIGNYAFSGCSGLTSVTIPSSVTTIGSFAFSGCSGLKKTNYTGTIADWCKIKFDDIFANPIYYSHNFYINNVEVKDLVIPEGVDKIGVCAFSGCSGLTSVTIGNSVTTIGNYAFSGCSGLTSVTIPNSVTTIGSRDYFSDDLGAFEFVNNIVYSGTATGSPWGAKCVNGYVEGYLVYSDATKTKLCACSYAATEIMIPSSVTTIGNGAFSGCSGLTSVTIPSSVTTIGSNAFSDCSGLKKTNYTGTIADWCKIKFSDYYANPMYYSHNFYVNDVEIIDLVIPQSLNTIGNYAFCGCSSLKSVTIPNSITTIGNYAFYYCKGLTSVTIPNSVTTIGSHAFANCSGLEKTNYTGTIADWCKIKFGGSTSNPMCYSHNFYINNVEVKDLVIPEGVDTIGECAFAGCSGLTSVTISNSVTTIGRYAFSECSSLTSVTIPNSVTEIGFEAFEGCSGLTSVTIPNSVTTIGGLAFNYCSGLTSVTIGNSVTTIGNKAFYDCTKLKVVYNCSNLNITKGSRDYGYVAYYADKVYNGELKGDWIIKNDTIVTGYIGTETDITIPDGIKEIGEKALYACKGLQRVVVPNSVEQIGDYVFADNVYLTDVVLGAKVTEIGCGAFAGDYRLENITCYAPVTPNACSTTFNGIDKSVVYLYVPADYQRKYQVDPNWKTFDIHLIGAEEKPITKDEVTVTPSATDATFTWPQNDQAAGYSLEITKDGVVFCTLKFNAQGQLIGIAFAPSRDGAPRMSQAAVLTANGWQFTVTGLSQASRYAYTMDALNAQQQSIKHYQGEFQTDGATGIEETLSSSTKEVSKFFRNGVLYILRDGKTYDAQGLRVE